MAEIEKEEQVSKKRTRRVFKKKILICKPVGTPNPEDADTFKAIAGPFDALSQAMGAIRRDLPDGNYVLMYEGRSVRKYTTPVSNVDVSE